MILSSLPFIAYDTSNLPDVVIQELLDKNNFIPSSLTYNNRSVNLNNSKRSSETHHLTYHETQTIFNLLNSRISELYSDSYSFDCVEIAQITKYEKGQEFKPHLDFEANPDRRYFIKSFPKAKHLAITNDRIATIILYLNDDFEGGTTDFPLLNIDIKPHKGNFLYFKYKEKNSVADLTLHRGTPVISGTKKILTIWIDESTSFHNIEINEDNE